MAQALVVDTAAAQSIRQEIGSRHLAAPEWPLKDDCHAQVMRRMIVAGEMLLHGEAQRQILEFDLAEPIMWQNENDPVDETFDAPMGACGRPRHGSHNNPSSNRALRRSCETR